MNELDANAEITELKAEVDYYHDLVDQKDNQIEELQEVVEELSAWVSRRKNKLHPMDPIHKTLQGAAELLPK